MWTLLLFLALAPAEVDNFGNRYYRLAIKSFPAYVSEYWILAPPAQALSQPNLEGDAKELQTSQDPFPAIHLLGHTMLQGPCLSFH